MQTPDMNDRWKPEWTRDLYWSPLDNDDDFDGFLYITNTKDGSQTRIDLRHILHQSRTELMRKVVGVVGKKLCPFHTEYNNCCNECAMFLPHNLNHSALIKLAEEEGIEL